MSLLYVGDAMRCRFLCVHAVIFTSQDPGTSEQEYGHAVANDTLQSEINVRPLL